MYPANKQCHTELANLTSKVELDIRYSSLEIVIVEPELAGKSKQISRAEYVSEDAWSGQSPDGGVIWILFKVSPLEAIDSWDNLNPETIECF